MRKVEISARTVSGLIGLVACYSLSIWLFWESQITLSNFRVDPEHSRFARFLIPFIGRDDAKIAGVIIAFFSVHLSWGGRYIAGDLIERLWHRFAPRKGAGNLKADSLDKKTNTRDIPDLIEYSDKADDSCKSVELKQTDNKHE